MKDVTKLNRWPIVTEERARFELYQRQCARDYDRASLHFDLLAFAASAVLTAMLSYLVVTFP